MFKTIILPIIGVAAFIIVVGVFMKKAPTFNQNQIQNKAITINNTSINVEVADTQEKRVKGLSGRTSLDNNTGMLFVFDTKSINTAFWMKDMLIPLDIIWIKDGKIIKIDKNIPAPASGTPDNKLIVYKPNQTVDFVLEVNAGFSDKNSIKVGQSLSGL